jgi:hypothetical protein
MLYDLFICHASKDKESVVAPLATALQAVGLRVWYDDFALRVGDSIRSAIDRGIVESLVGVVVLSRAFFEQRWPQWELSGLVQRLNSENAFRILPLWHNIDHSEVAQYSPSLADIRAIAPANDVQIAAAQIRGAIERVRQAIDPDSAAGLAHSHRHGRSLGFADALQAAVSGFRELLLQQCNVTDLVISLYVPLDLNPGSDLELIARAPFGVKKLKVVPGGDRVAKALGMNFNSPIFGIMPETFSDAIPNVRSTSRHYIYYDYNDPSTPHLFGVLTCESAELNSDEWSEMFGQGVDLFAAIVLALDAKARAQE